MVGAHTGRGEPGLRVRAPARSGTIDHVTDPTPPLPRPAADTTAVLLPGTGSDADFVSRALGPLAAWIATRVVAVQAEHGRLTESYRRALDEAAADGPVLVAGVSIGAMIGARWARERPESLTGLIAAMPAWCGDPEPAPAAASARHTAHLLDHTGLPATIAAMRAGSPPWLADELARSWTALGDGLAATMREAGAHHAIEAHELAGITAPTVVVSATDDPLHPLTVGRAWAAHLPRARLATFTLDELGADPAVLSDRGARAWHRVIADHPAR